jgi:hypothetical protein
MDKMPQSVQEKLKEIRSFDDNEFADLIEHNVRYYLKHGEKFNYDPDELIERISEILCDVNKVPEINTDKVEQIKKLTDEFVKKREELNRLAELINELETE